MPPLAVPSAARHLGPEPPSVVLKQFTGGVLGSALVLWLETVRSLPGSHPWQGETAASSPCEETKVGCGKGRILPRPGRGPQGNSHSLPCPGAGKAPGLLPPARFCPGHREGGRQGEGIVKSSAMGPRPVRCKVPCSASELGSEERVPGEASELGICDLALDEPLAFSEMFLLAEPLFGRNVQPANVCECLRGLPCCPYRGC